jgi:hypothetical protein
MDFRPMTAPGPPPLPLLISSLLRIVISTPHLRNNLLFASSNALADFFKPVGGQRSATLQVIAFGLFSGHNFKKR